VSWDFVESRCLQSGELTVSVLGETVGPIRVVQPVGGRDDEAGVNGPFESVPHGSFGDTEFSIAGACWPSPLAAIALRSAVTASVRATLGCLCADGSVRSASAQASRSNCGASRRTCAVASFSSSEMVCSGNTGMSRRAAVVAAPTARRTSSMPNLGG
jgi:hypothetical protein